MRDKTDEELEQLADEIRTEQTRRADLKNLPGMIHSLIAQWEEMNPDNPDGWRHAGGDEQ